VRKTFLCFWVIVFAGIASALTLRESVDLALRANPAVLVARKKVEAAEAKLAQARGTFLPTIKLEGNYGKSYTQPSTIQFTTQSATGSATQTIAFGTDAAQSLRGWQASLSQPLFVAGLFPGLGLASRNADSVREDYLKVILDTSFNVTQAYFQLLAAAKMVGLSKESKQMAQTHLEQVNSMYAVGTATRSDTLRGEVQLANSEVGLTRARNQLELAKNAFNNVLGRNLEEAVLLSEDGFAGKVAPPEYRGLLKIAFENRPDWKQYLLSGKMGEDNLRLAQTASLPTVMLSANSAKNIIQNPSYTSDVNSWAVTAAASWILFDGLGIQNRIREAQANLEAQKAGEEQVRGTIALEVRDAYLNLKSVLETRDSTEKAVKATEENYQVSTSRYASGAGTNLELLDAQVSLTQARINYLQSQFDLELAKARINKIVGKEVL
jgi:outer membrane protein TolC